MSQELRPFNSQGSGGRSDRLSVLAFVNDSPTEQVIRDGLSDIVANGIEIRRGGIRSAINAMGKLQTPEVLIVDLSSEEQPLKSLNELADLVEPGVRILTIGNTDDVEFYRQIIREVGVLEYIFKPITRESVARHFAPLISKKTANSPALDSTRGGRVISIIGARGGVGATTIATNLAWYLGAISKRHSVYLESEMHMASGATMLGSTAGIGLKVALEFPDQINALFLEQAAVPVSERLHVISNEERIGTSINYTPGAGKKLIDALRVRYNFIVLDVPLVPEPYNIEMINHAHHRVIVMDPSLASIRDTLRLLAVPNGRWQPQSPTIVLNKYGKISGLTLKQIEIALKVKIDLVIPDMPKQMIETQVISEPAITQSSVLRALMVSLAREAGFSGGRDEVGEQDAPKPSVGFFKKLLAQK